MDTAQRWTVSLVAMLSPLAAFGLLLWGVLTDSDGPIWGFFLATLLWILFAPLGVLFGVRSYREKGEVAGLVLSATSSAVLAVILVLLFAEDMLG